MVNAGKQKVDHLAMPDAFLIILSYSIINLEQQCPEYKGQNN